MGLHKRETSRKNTNGPDDSAKNCRGHSQHQTALHKLLSVFFFFYNPIWCSSCMCKYYLKRGPFWITSVIYVQRCLPFWCLHSARDALIMVGSAAYHSGVYTQQALPPRLPAVPSAVPPSTPTLSTLHAEHRRASPSLCVLSTLILP
jgi:hypothetical protein